MKNIRLQDSFIKIGNSLGESPLWDQNTQKLLWVDINHGVIHNLNPRNKQLKSYNVGNKIGSIALYEDESLLLATDTGFSNWNKTTGLAAEFLQVFNSEGPVMFNDGKVDAKGNFWIGTKGPHGESALYILNSSGTLELKIPDLTISNGLDWSPDLKSFYHTDSGDQAIYRYDFDSNTNSLSGKSVFFKPEIGTPDGLTVDIEGNLWVAIWDGYKVVQLNQEGELMTEIHLPVPRPTSVALGGSNLRTLFITSATDGIDVLDLFDQPMSGDLFAVNVKTPGRPPNRLKLNT